MHLPNKNVAIRSAVVNVGPDDRQPGEEALRALIKRAQRLQAA